MYKASVKHKMVLTAGGTPRFSILLCLGVCAHVCFACKSVCSYELIYA